MNDQLKKLQKENDDLKRERDELLAKLELPPRPDRITMVANKETGEFLVRAFTNITCAPSSDTHPDVIMHAGSRFSCDTFHFILRNDVRIRQNLVIDSLILDPTETST